MTDRHAAYIVVLDEDIREDSGRAEATLIALRMIHGVVSVEPVTADISLVIARGRRDRQWSEALSRVVSEVMGEVMGRGG